MATAILEASARILESEGLPGFNARSIATRATMSTGLLYRYFPDKEAIVLALIAKFKAALQDALLESMQAGKGMQLKPRLRLVIRALVTVHYHRPRLNRVLEAEEERLGGGAENAAFHAIMLQFLREHKNEVTAPITAATERVVVAILEALVHMGLTSGTSQRSTEQQAFRAVAGYLLYAV